ncbi:uncharacterized protein EV422DRAFT_107238 [Fimicolochytrium jonesii]|uniref:uncharacterized protein n=1 Tax=Fimicolochytrium jonesii TaxID=1396493 RepID=UPI0022FE8D74|nr:uncharacterized protein EV422DRAFT_107238 [Fimicolochytrium jonesii]KAI8819311.1 hypothetical protein EV422DRAFT_107238 [Fimicolochytrium jonesii]
MIAGERVLQQGHGPKSVPQSSKPVLAKSQEVRTRFPPVAPHKEAIVSAVRVGSTDVWSATDDDASLRASASASRSAKSSALELLGDTKPALSGRQQSDKTTNVLAQSPVADEGGAPPSKRSAAEKLLCLNILTLQNDDMSNDPFLLLNEFLACIASKSYPRALQISAKILSSDPTNAMMKEYQPVLRTRIAQIKEAEEDEEGEESSDEDDSEDNSQDEVDHGGSDDSSDESEDEDQDSGNGSSASDSDLDEGQASGDFAHDEVLRKERGT